MKYYKNLDNLSAFTNPDFNCKFRYMNEKESVLLAKKITEKFNQTKHKNIVVIESGTSPLIQIIKNLKSLKDKNLLQIKIPRELNFNLYEWFKFYIAENEFKPIEKEMISLCKEISLPSIIKEKKFTIIDSINDNFEYDIFALKKFNKILKNTTLSKIFQDEFLLFDEYINAGTIIRNFNLISKLFNINAKFKLSAFCIFVDNYENYNKIEFSLFDKRNEFQCYNDGAYPFENRIDLIGYYFYINKDSFKKVILSDLRKQFNQEKKTLEFEKLLDTFIDEYDLVNKAKNFCQGKEVCSFINKNDLARFIIKELEKSCFGSSIYYDFLDQTFEMFAPAWSPMPVKNHLDYWQAMDKVQSNIESLKKPYIQNRNNIFSSVISILTSTKTEWENKILKEIKND